MGIVDTLQHCRESVAMEYDVALFILWFKLYQAAVSLTGFKNHNYLLGFPHSMMLSKLPVSSKDPTPTRPHSSVLS